MMKPVGKVSTSCEKRCQARKASPGMAITGRQERVGGNDPREPVGVFTHQAKTDQAAPVLAHERHVVQVERPEEGVVHPGDVAGIGVVGALRRLVGSAEAHQVDGDHPQPGTGQHGDHVPVEV